MRNSFLFSVVYELTAAVGADAPRRADLPHRVARLRLPQTADCLRRRPRRPQAGAALARLQRAGPGKEASQCLLVLLLRSDIIFPLLMYSEKSHRTAGELLFTAAAALLLWQLAPGMQWPYPRNFPRNKAGINTKYQPNSRRAPATAASSPSRARSSETSSRWTFLAERRQRAAVAPSICSGEDWTFLAAADPQRPQHR